MRYLLMLICLTLLPAQSFIRNGVFFQPIQHGTFMMQVDTVSIYVDPTGDLTRYVTVDIPDIILVTDIHGDHMDIQTINNIKTERTFIVVPQAVADSLGDGLVLNNGESEQIMGITIEAIPMYNTTKGRLDRHQKGRGNGYVLTINNQRIYISGDTEDIPEMRALKDIDVAFVCMNLPYTMSVKQAASAVLEFKPKVAVPYHYRGKNGKSDINTFKKLVMKGDATIQVMLLNWYAGG